MFAAEEDAEEVTGIGSAFGSTLFNLTNGLFETGLLLLLAVVELELLLLLLVFEEEVVVLGLTLDAPRDRNPN